LARGLVRRAGRPAPGARHPAQRGRHPSRTENPPAGGAQQHGPARSRGARPAPLRAPEQRRGRPGPGPRGIGGQQALPPCPEEAQGDPVQHARRHRGGVTMATPSSGRDPVEKLAEEFAERYRRGERPSLAEYTEKYPELADQIRELFPALVEMEQFGSLEGPPAGPHLPTVPSGRMLPRQLGEYGILREVGRGGMGVVYEAVQESLGRHVALKVLTLHGLLSPTHLERFRREAKAAARLHHTNIVPVFGVGEDR